LIIAEELVKRSKNDPALKTRILSEIARNTKAGELYKIVLR